MTDIPRQTNGKFAPGPRNVDVVKTPEQKALLRQQALMRADIDYRPISINGVVYPNLSRAAKVHGVSAASLRRYALSDKDIFKHVFFTDHACEGTPDSNGGSLSPRDR